MRFPGRNRCAPVVALAVAFCQAALLWADDGAATANPPAVPQIDSALAKLESGASAILGLWMRPPTRIGKDGAVDRRAP